ncbi:hypothetical protein HDU85_002929 [Gaertneriomyces sp. JEL0708]|nr:hypothetical protein HDU85_002929 [Gaertneriomyces sp. JEL0708]
MNSSVPEVAGLLPAVSVKDLLWTVYDTYAATAAGAISKTGLSNAASLRFVHCCSHIMLFGFLAVVYMELIYQWSRMLYHFKLVRRHQLALPDDRDYFTNFFAATSIVTAPIFYLGWRWDDISDKITYKFNLWQVLAFHVFIFFLQDIWYFHGHRFMHKNKFFWNHVHSHHHEKKNINAFSTGYAAWIENFLLVGPVILASVFVMDWLMPEFNMTTVRLAWLSQFKVFIIGHSGMKMSALLYFPNPFAFLAQQLLSPVGLSQIPEDHEMHHLYPMSNFSLNYRLLDKLRGSYRSIDTLRSKKTS